MDNLDSVYSYFSISTVAQKLGVSQKTIRRHIASGTLVAIKVGGVFRIPKSAVESFINSPINGSAIVGYDLFGNEIPLVKKTRSGTSYKNNHKDNVQWVDISLHWDNPGISEMTFVDLFSGAGGITKGLELAGMRGICGMDWFEAAGKTYKRNFSHAFVEGDIKSDKVKKEFLDTVKQELKGNELSVVAGGFPCQGFSMAGNRIVDDPRNSLYIELLEIVKDLRPQFVVCENVVGLRTMLKGKVEQKILEDFKSVGYNMNVTVLRAADYMVPQKRDRVIFIGNRVGLKNLHPKPLLSPENYITTGEAIKDLMNLEPNPKINHVPTKHGEKMRERLAALEEGKSLYKGYSDAWKKCPWDEASCTIKENHGGVNVHPKLPRVITAREMARLQSFSDDFIFEGPKSKQLVQLGNAVPPLLAKAIGLSIRIAAGELSN